MTDPTRTTPEEQARHLLVQASEFCAAAMRRYFQAHPESAQVLARSPIQVRILDLLSPNPRCNVVAEVAGEFIELAFVTLQRHDMGDTDPSKLN